MKRKQSLICSWTCATALAAMSLQAYSQVSSPQSLSKNAIIQCADAGVAECQYRLGQMVEQGTEVERNTLTAKQLYELAYANGFEVAGQDILRLAKVVPRESPSKPAEGTNLSTSVEPSISWWVNSSPEQPNSSAAPAPPSNANVAVVTPVAARAVRVGAASIGGFKLMQSEAEFLAMVSSGTCETDATYALRACTGNFRLESGQPLSATALFKQNNMVNLLVATPNLDECMRLRQDVAARNGKPMRGFTAWAFRKLTEGSLEMWGKRNDWMIISGCDAAETATELMARSSPRWAGE